MTTLTRAGVSAPALTPTLLAETVRRYASRPDRWRPYVRFDGAERYYTRLEPTGAHEIWLPTWLPGQGTGIHDHGGASGAFAVAQGELTERTFSIRPVRPSPWVLHAGAIRAFGPRHVHEVRNHGTEPAVPVHAYAPALAAVADGAVLVDTRPEFQRRVSGTIPGALVIERNHLEWRLDPSSSAAVDRVAPGNRSDRRLQAWRRAGLPVDPPG